MTGRGRGAAEGPRRRGTTLLELVLVVGVLAMVMGGAFSVAFHSGRLFTAQVAQVTLDETGRRILDRLSQELRPAEPSTLYPLAISDSSYVQFQKVTGYQAGAVQLSAPVTLSFQLAPGETQNGKDDNGNGRIDEGFLALSYTTGAPVLLAGNVLALRFNPIANGLSFSVDVGLLDEKGKLIQKTFNQAVWFRN